MSLARFNNVVVKTRKKPLQNPLLTQACNYLISADNALASQNLMQ